MKKKIFKKIDEWFKSKYSKQTLYIILTIAFLLVSSVVLICFIEYRHRMGGGLINAFLGNTPLLFYTIAIVFSILLFLTGVTGNAIYAANIFFSICVLATFASINKFLSRGAPLLPEDLEMATEIASLSQMVNVRGIIMTIALIVLMTIFCVIVSRFLKKNVIPTFSKKTRIISRIAIIIASCTFLVVGTDFIRNPRGDNYEAIDWLGTELVAWNQAENYNRNGFIIGFIYNMQTKKIDKPEGYSEESVSSIISKYEDVANSNNSKKTSLSDEDINILLVMNESFIDPARLSKYYPYSGGDVTPNLRKIMENTTSGYMYSVDYGGGTANIEYEALTGLSNFFYASAVPYSHFVSRMPNFPSIASIMREQGYKTIGMHPFNGAMYKRDSVYRNLGFDNFYDYYDFEYTDTTSDNVYVSDESSYKQLLYQLNSTDEKQFITLVTMQNHMPFGERYSKNKRHFSSNASHIDDWNNEQIEDYLESLYLSDQALGNLVSELDKIEKKTVLLFFGDHLPGLYNDLPSDAGNLRFETPVFMYSNFNTSNEDLGVISPNYIGNELFNYIDAQKPWLYYLLDDLKETYPILAKSYFGRTELETSEVLTDYSFINYWRVSK